MRSSTSSTTGGERSGPGDERPGFKAMLDRIAGNGVRVILVESPDRFARDLAVQLAGHDYLKRLGVELVPASAPDFFLDGHPDGGAGAAGARRNLAVREGELVAKLKAARERKRAAGGRGTGRFPSR